MVIQATQRVILSSSSLIHSVTDDFTMHLVDIAKKALQSPYYQEALSVHYGSLTYCQYAPEHHPREILRLLHCAYQTSYSLP